MGALLDGAVALRRRIFKQKKGFANLSLGLNYHPKALPQPPSSDTVPLISSVHDKSAYSCEVNVCTQAPLES
jgi:hypothetical protein